MSSAVSNPSASAEPITTKQLAAIQSDTVMNLQGKLKAKTPETTTVQRFHIARSSDGSYRLIEQPARTDYVVSEPCRPGKLYETNLAPCAAMRDFFEQGPDAWAKSPDRAVWQLALEAARVSGFDGQACRTWARAVSAALEIRAGQSCPTAHQAV